ncbi:hypothetical protein [Sphingomonas cavernae]|uniref:VanZ family protein n=1 Tax=Sphingomonas cavernae TaxID=2320861 RepID=A0A418WP92_9SPHN|nr:hypothetical protein [Sphingomonas cavernae]RJF93057.1 hypothetical protein D3876_01370 [Sphingomonas cavernae]
MQFVSAYAELKAQVAAWTSLSDPILHTHLGMLVFVATAVLLRKPFRSPIPLLMVTLFEALNECLDRINHGSWRWPNTLSDVAFTLVWPILIFLLARARKLRAG